MIVVDDETIVPTLDSPWYYMDDADANSPPPPKKKTFHADAHNELSDCWNIRFIKKDNFLLTF